MSKKIELSILAGLLVLTGFFATYKLTESPSVWYDEGIYIQTAMNLADGYGMTFQFAPGHLVDMMPRFTVGYPFVYLLAGVFEIFGASVLSARSTMVVLIFALSILGYLVVRKRFGPVVALSALALIITFPPLYGNGKSVLGEVPALVSLFATLIFFRKAQVDQIQAHESKTKVWIILAGFFAGICAATKLSFLLFLPAFALVAFLSLRRKQISIADFFLAGIFSFLPFATWAFIQYQSLDSTSTIFNFYANPYGVTNLFVVIKDNIINFFTEAGPLYLLGLMVVWTIGIVIRKINKKEIYLEEIMSFVFCILVCLAYLRIVGWHRYVFSAQIVALLYFVPSVRILVEWIFGKPKMSIVAVVVAGLSLWGVYGVLFNSWVATAYQSHKTAFWEEYFKNMPPDKSVLFYDTPEVAIFDQNRNYYQYMNLQSVGGPFGKEWLELVKKGEIDQVIIRTDFYKDEKDVLFGKYHIVLQPYKYTILDSSTPDK